MKYNIRNTAPSRDNNWYYTSDNKYYSKNEKLVGQCTWYAFGRFSETLGGQCKLGNANAKNWYNQEVGYKKGNTPKLGAIICFGGTKYGHVAVVEEIGNDYIMTSEYNWTSMDYPDGDKKFHYAKRLKSGNYELSGSSVKFQGFIYQPVEFEEEKEEPSTHKFKIGDEVIISGKLYKSSNADSASGSISEKVTKITRIAEGSKHPYNTTGDLGWMDEFDIKLYQGDNKEILYLPATAKTWNVYPMDKQPVVGNECGKLLPSKFGGLEYDILGWTTKNTAIIKTRDFGKVQIYVAPSTGAIIK